MTAAKSANGLRWLCEWGKPSVVITLIVMLVSAGVAWATLENRIGVNAGEIQRLQTAMDEVQTEKVAELRFRQVDEKLSSIDKRLDKIAEKLNVN